MLMNIENVWEKERGRGRVKAENCTICFVTLLNMQESNDQPIRKIKRIPLFNYNLSTRRFEEFRA